MNEEKQVSLFKQIGDWFKGLFGKKSGLNYVDGGDDFTNTRIVKSDPNTVWQLLYDAQRYEKEIHQLINEQDGRKLPQIKALGEKAVKIAARLNKHGKNQAWFGWAFYFVLGPERRSRWPGDVDAEWAVELMGDEGAYFLPVEYSYVAAEPLIKPAGREVICVSLGDDLQDSRPLQKPDGSLGLSDQDQSNLELAYETWVKTEVTTYNPRGLETVDQVREKVKKQKIEKRKIERDRLEDEKELEEGHLLYSLREFCREREEAAARVEEGSIDTVSGWPLTIVSKLIKRAGLYETEMLQLHKERAKPAVDLQDPITKAERTLLSIKIDYIGEQLYQLAWVLDMHGKANPIDGWTFNFIPGPCVKHYFDQSLVWTFFGWEDTPDINASLRRGAVQAIREKPPEKAVMAIIPFFILPLKPLSKGLGGDELGTTDKASLMKAYNKWLDMTLPHKQGPRRKPKNLIKKAPPKGTKNAIRLSALEIRAQILKLWDRKEEP